MIAGMLEDGSDPEIPGRVLANTLGGQSHDGIVRALPAAIVAGSDDGGRRHLAARLVSVTHASDVAVASAGVVADAAAAWIRGEGGVRQAGHEPLRARSLRDDSDDWSACALDVVRSTIAVAGSTPGIVEAVEAVRSRWWGDARAAVLVGALAGARHGEEAIPLAWRHPVVDRKGLARVADRLFQRPRRGARLPLLARMA
jgi:ADP-ribosylglycohydrolase